MSVYRRKDSGGWVIHVAVKGRPEYRHTAASTLTKREAQEIERAVRVEIEAGRDPRRVRDAGRPEPIKTWGQLRARWWEQRGKHLGWADRAEDHLDRISAAVGDGKPLADLSTADFAAAIARWRVERPTIFYKRAKGAAEEKKVHLAPNGPTTINTRLRVAQGVLNYAADVLAGECVPPQAIAWKKLWLAEPDRDPLSLHIPAAIRDAVTAAASPHVRLAIKIQEQVGFRISSVLALDWSRLDREQQIGSVPVKSRKPGGKTLVFPLTPDLIALLDEAAGGDEWPAKGPVITWRGERVASIKKAVQRTRAKVGAPSFKLKNVRHSTAIEIIAATGSIDAASKTLGHSDPSITKRHYGDLDVSAVRRAMEARDEHARSTRAAQEAKKKA